MDGFSILDDFQAEMLLGKRQYQRMNVQLTESIPLDGCSKIGDMQELVESYLQEVEIKPYC